MSTLNDIKDVLDELETKLRTVLAEELGTFSNGQPAIWRGPALIPPELKTTGLQCLIQGVPKGDTIPMSSGQKLSDYSYGVDLVNFANDAKLAIAKRRIEQAFPLKREPRYQPPTTLTLEKCEFWIYKPTVHNPLS